MKKKIKLSHKELSRTFFRNLDFVRGQGFIRFKSGAHTVVREHFETDYNTALGQKIIVCKPVYGDYCIDDMNSLASFIDASISLINLATSDSMDTSSLCNEAIAWAFKLCFKYST
jgi:hypothetical protein